MGAVEQTLHRLTDIQSVEVSIVDHAANKRRFVAMKSEGNMKKNGTEVVADGKGGHTTAKEAPGTETTSAPPTPPPVPAAAAPASDPPTKLRISPETKAELSKRVSGAMEKLMVLKSLLETNVEEVAGLTDVPASLIDGFGDVLHLLAEGDGESATTKAVTKTILKGRKQISTTREASLRIAYQEIGSILNDLGEQQPVTDPPPPAPVADPAPGASAADVTAEIGKRFDALEGRVTKVLSGMLGAIEKQGHELASIAKSAVSPASGNGSSEIEPAPVEKSETVWPFDMNGGKGRR